MKLRCPICKNELISKGNSLVCINNHTYDYSKFHTVHLYTSSKSLHGDNKDMVNARSSFLNKDYYLNLKDELYNIMSKLDISSFIDLGCGEGYYTNDLQAKLDIDCIGIDLSKTAVNHASKSNKNIQYVIASTFNLPIFDESVDCVLNIFAPYSVEEVIRVLKINHYFITVQPNEKHLIELKEIVYDNVYLNTVKTISDPHLKLIESISLNNTINITNNNDLLELFSMTPYLYKTSISDKEKLNKINSLNISTEFIIQIYQKI